VECPVCEKPMVLQILFSSVIYACDTCEYKVATPDLPSDPTDSIEAYHESSPLPG